MSRPLRADVIVPVYGGAEMTSRCLESVLIHGGPALRSLIVVDDVSPEPRMAVELDRIARRDPRVRVLRNEANLGFVGSCNRGLAKRQGDAVLLNSDTIATAGWLQELAEAAHSDARTACASPLSNNATFYSVPEFNEATDVDDVDAQAVLAACAGLPRWTEMPTGHGFCLYLRAEALDLVGGFDPIFAPGYSEENDWVMRAQALGFVARRANRAFVYHLGSRSFRAEAVEHEKRNARILTERHPHFRPQIDRAYYDLEARYAAHAARVETTGRLRLALDLRHVPPDAVGTAVYSIGLARALSKLPEIDLTLVVRDPAQAGGVPGRIVGGADRLEDVEVIHKPAQVFDPADLPLLFGSPAHAMVTHLDLIAHRAQVVFQDPEIAARYRATSGLVLQAAQGVVAISEDSRREIMDGFGLSADEVFVTHLGVSADRFADEPGDDPLATLDLPGRFFLTVGTDFPHKNLRNLVDAHALLRERWSSPGEPPSLVLVGSMCAVRDGAYRTLVQGPPAGVVYLGSVTNEQLAALYRRAEAMVFPSIYEGFGLPPLEAMAAGSPVIAMPISSVPEICGDAALYPDGFAPADLARAMERLAVDQDLRLDLLDRGRKRVEQFTWEKTAKATVDAYRRVVRQPSERSLRMRRCLVDAILRWSEPRHVEPQPIETLPIEPTTLGIFDACNAVNHAVRRRLRREISRFPAVGGRKRA